MTISLYPKRRGFTLAELMVAMSITIILLTLLVSVTGVALDGWRISRNKVRAARQGKAALDQLSRDFESLIVRSGNNFEWFFAESMRDAPGPNNNKSPNAARLIFYTAASDRYDGNVLEPESKGDVSAVGYKLFYKDPITGRDNTRYDVFALYRNLVNPDLAFEDLLATEDLSDAFRSYDVELDESRNYVCENIFEMSVVFTVEYTTTGSNNQPITQIERIPILSSGSDAVKEFRILGTGLEVDGNSNTDYARGRVVSVDITVAVLTDNGISTLRKVDFDGIKKEEFLEKNSYRYSKTILLPQP